MRGMLKRGNQGALRLGLKLAMVVCAAVAIYCAASLLLIFHEDRETARAYAAIQTMAAAGTDAGKEGAQGVDRPSSPIDFEALRSINEDVVGWLRAEHIGVDYPVVQGEDNAEYLHKGFDGAERFAGCLFLDFEAPGDFQTYNATVYGHNMRDESMFGQLKFYFQRDIPRDLPLYLYTPEGSYKLTLFSAYRASAEGNYHSPITDWWRWAEQLEEWAQRSELQFDAKPDLAKNVVTLVTCTPDERDERYVFHAVCEAL